MVGRTTRTLFLVGAVCLNAWACSDDSSGKQQGRLPADPNEWVCSDSLAGATQAEIDAWCAANPDRGRSLPSELQTPPPLSDLEAKNAYDLALEVFVKALTYRLVLGWYGDTTWRFTGPYVGDIGSGYNYGTHLPVRIYYSPEVIDWLCNGRHGALPAGAAIIKEMTLVDSNLEVTIDSEGCMEINADVTPLAWAIMVKHEGESNDGWYWPLMQRSGFPLYPEERIDPPIVDRSGYTNDSFVVANPTAPDSSWYPTGYYSENADKVPNVIQPQNGYGPFCVACHASASQESTFVSLDNVLGKHIRYKQFPAPEGDTASAYDNLGTHVLALTSSAETTVDGSYDTPFQTPLAAADEAFLSFYDQLTEVSFTRAWDVRLPGETYDHVAAAAGGASSFLTSDQCASCHDALKYLADTSNMVTSDEKNGEMQEINLSPAGEWSVSPMGLAGRDPIFFAQLESETNNLPDLDVCIEDTCLHCHGVMGERQLAEDTAGGGDACADFFAVPPPPGVPQGEPFRLEMVMQWPGSLDRSKQQYGALARDGISCTVCHRVAADALGSESSYTGNFVTAPPTEVFGPYEDVVTVGMENSLGVTPGFAEQIDSADLCGSCHNILLPVFANDGSKVGFSYEQTTHLEWLNSDYAPGRPRAQTCQGCHMPTQYDGEPLAFEVANFESSQFPPTTYRVPNDDIALTTRTHFARHSLHGVNVFLNQMFQQFPLLLGFRQAERFNRTTLDYPPLLLGQDSMVDMAQEQTASIAIERVERKDGRLSVVVDVTNRTGHYLPSGVGFRRMFIELLVRGATGDVLWASGRTNELGLLLNGRSEEILETERPLSFPQSYQPHYQVIASEDEVQIYEEIVEDSDGNRTTSFLRRFQERKDNRIRPDGYDPQFYDTFSSPYIRALAETPGHAADDPDYVDPKRTGADEVEYLLSLPDEALDRVARVDATLYYQSIPPPYLQERFRDAQRGPEKRDQIDRLYYMTSHLQTDGIVDGDGREILKDWKLQIATATAEPRN